MYHLILAAELMFGASASLTAFYLRRKYLTLKSSFPLSSAAGKENLLRLQKIYGYSAHSLVAISINARSWFDFKTQSGLAFTEHGKIRLVAGEMMAEDEQLQVAVHKFIEQAKMANKLVAFLPTTEKFAKAVAPLGFEAVKIGASPYFDLQTWNPRGDKAKKMRAGVNQAKRAGVSVEQVSEFDKIFRDEVLDLSESWLKTRRAKIKFGWLFELAPFHHSVYKKYFSARDSGGKLVGLLAASPIPAREGWYLEDVLRYAHSPKGTTDLLVYQALKKFAGEGAKLATLGTVPLASDGANSLVTSKYHFAEKILLFSSKNFNSLYNFNGLRRFKAKFVPSWWESEYILLPKGFLVSPRVINTLLHAVLQDGLLSLIKRQKI